jgi:hypothetical protein
LNSMCYALGCFVFDLSFKSSTAGLAAIAYPVPLPGYASARSVAASATARELLIVSDEGCVFTWNPVSAESTSTSANANAEVGSDGVFGSVGNVGEMSSFISPPSAAGAATDDLTFRIRTRHEPCHW